MVARQVRDGALSATCDGSIIMMLLPSSPVSPFAAGRMVWLLGDLRRLASIDAPTELVDISPAHRMKGL
jgi:hypothetical protein